MKYLYSLLLLCHSFAYGSVHPQCENIELAPLNTTNSSTEYKKLLGNFKIASERYFNLAETEIYESIRCVENDDVSDVCENKMTYFYEVLPRQLEEYRTNLALSDYNNQYSYFSSVKPKYSFNTELKSPEIFWYQTGNIESLDDQEAESVANIVKLKWAAIAKRIVAEMDEVRNEYEKNPNGISERIFLSQYEIMTKGTFSDVYLYYKKNRIIRYLKWTKKAIDQFENIVQKLSKKRLIHQLATHPILYFIEKRTITKENLLAALYKMEGNLKNSQSKMHFKLNDLSRIRKTANKNRLGKLSWRDFDFINDNILILKFVLENDRSMCGIVELISKNQRWNGYLQTSAIIAASVGLFFFASPVVAIGGFSVMHAMVLADSYESLQEISNKAFLNPQRELNQFDSTDVYMKLNEFGTNVLVTPVILAGVPMMKFRNIIKYLK